MLLRSLEIAGLLGLSVPFSAQALPVCYMDMDGIRTDLTYMCGSGESEPISIAASSVVNTQASALEPTEAQRQVSADIQINRAQYQSFSGDTIVNVTVEFGRSSHVGDSAVPVLNTSSGPFSFQRVILARGQKSYNYNLRLPGLWNRTEIDAQLVDLIAVD